MHIVSDGFDSCIERILSGAGPLVARALDHVRVFSSRLVNAGGSWQVEFPFFSEPCAHGCATCKPAVMQALNPTGGRAIFVGDGLSDKYAAQSADLIFAKGKLADYCREANLSYVLYDDLGRVALYLDSLLRAAAFEADAVAEALEA